MSDNSGRVFIIDHMCVLPYGHNLNALVLFEKALQGSFSQSFALASRHLPDEAEQSAQVLRELKYPYRGLIPVPVREPVSGKTAASSSKVLGQIATLAWRAMYTGCNVVFGYDYMRASLKRDWKKVFRRHRIGKGDCLFFPSSEFYGCVSLLDFLCELPESARPSAHFRLIGVMESASYELESGRPRFFRELRRATEAGINLSLSAETPAYCEFVERITGLKVEFLPYPLANAQSEVTWGENKVVSSPGQGRADKGFMRLQGIVKRVQERVGTSAFRFDVQDMRKGDRHFRKRYRSILSYTPNLRLRPARLKQVEIDQMYREADIFLLPYDSSTYSYRGSAVFQEGIAVGRPVVCGHGLGFSTLVEKYGNGLLASTDVEFAECIIEMASWGRDEVSQRMVDARMMYEKDFSDGLRAVVASITR
ncbi:glycosyltransferase [Rhizobium sp. L51/94]|uniref:glycosyltransferase n=1 Tax=Rhizobium sp. L51/94 TaxID=2819999 RepID=UPI001C5B670C|nr:hypothetical protein [Rhizobium sp. L51/94]QXZ80906.1 hypothetical protein J5274_18425 [Rhizobium sp. L51/94]